ncbi:hypothetical protein ACFRDV_31925 [Streptomyces fagopyri]|uniref:hypothetical protein n=1 Tax=Streptomyces fagopyri TaxID=2662397 RepID=UPI0036C4A386
MRLGRALATGVAEEQVRADEEDLRRTGKTEGVAGIEEIAEPETSAAAEVPAAR